MRRQAPGAAGAERVDVQVAVGESRTRDVQEPAAVRRPHGRLVARRGGDDAIDAATRASQRDPAAPVDRPIERDQSWRGCVGRQRGERGEAAECESQTGTAAHGPIFAAPLGMLPPMTNSAEAGIS